MRTDCRPVDPHFHPEEFLFRRVPTWMWDHQGDELGVDAVQLPDISVGRSKHAHPEWVRFDVVNGTFFEDWGVVGVQVQDIPPEMWRDGVFRFTFRACHAPLERDYPHSEIRAFEDGVHVNASARMPEDIHLIWRERLLRRLRTIIKPHQKVVIRQTPPVSHKLETFTTVQ